MTLRTITYTSRAAPGLDADALQAIHDTARTLNAIDGITGLLVFNGTHFLQIVEGPPAPIYRLVERLRRDPRHSGLEIRDDSAIEVRSFRDWSMEVVEVSPRFFDAKECISNRLPSSLEAHVRNRVLRMTEAISAV